MPRQAYTQYRCESSRVLSIPIGQVTGLDASSRWPSDQQAFQQQPDFAKLRHVIHTVLRSDVNA